jgi:WD40 repeat protein
MEKKLDITDEKPTHFWTIPHAACGPMVLLNKTATVVMWPDEGKTPVVRIADIHAKKYKHLLAHKKAVTLLSLHPDENKLATLSDIIRIFDLNSGKSNLTFDTDLKDNWINSLEWSDDGMSLSSTDANNKIRSWDMHTGRENKESIIQVHFINNMSASTALWTMAARQEITDPTAIKDPKITKISPNKLFKAHADVDENSIEIYDSTSKILLKTIVLKLRKESVIETITWMGNDHIAVTAEEGKGGVFSVQEGTLLHRYTSKNKRSYTEPAYANGTIAYGNLTNQKVEIVKYAN